MKRGYIVLAILLFLLVGTILLGLLNNGGQYFGNSISGQAKIASAYLFGKELEVKLSMLDDETKLLAISSLKSDDLCETRRNYFKSREGEMEKDGETIKVRINSKNEIFNFTDCNKILNELVGKRIAYDLILEQNIFSKLKNYFRALTGLFAKSQDYAISGEFIKITINE